MKGRKRQSGRRNGSWTSGSAGALVLCLLAGGGSAAAAERVDVLAPAADLAAAGAGLRVLEDGQEVTGWEVGETDEEWRTVLLVDQLLTTSLVLKSAALELGAVAAELTALGSVEVVLLGEETALSLPATRDTARLEEALSWIAVREGGAGEQLATRRRFLTGPAMSGLAADEYSAVSATAGRQVAELVAEVRQAVTDEASVLERQRLRLLDWLAAQPVEASGSKNLLVLVSEGWDEDPLAYYRKVLRRIRMEDSAAGLSAPAASPETRDVARAFSATGWRVLAVKPSRLAESASLIAESESGEPKDQDRVETVIQDGREVERTLLEPVDPRDLWRRLRGGPLEAELLAAGEPLEALAAATGGVVADGSRAIRRALDSAASLARVSYSRPPSASPAEWRRVEVKRPGGGEVPTRRWVSAYRPEVLAEARARRLIEEDIEEGVWSVEARYLDEEGTVQVAAAAAESASRIAPPLRVTLAVARADGSIEFSHRIVDEEDLDRMEDDFAGVALKLPAGGAGEPEALAVVVLEEPDADAWGSGFVRHGAAGAVRAVDAGGSFVLPAPRAIHLLAPSEPMVVGPTVFDTVVSGPAVERVDFYLDGELELSRGSPPFTVQMDLGRLPRPRRVDVVAFNADGLEVGRDSLTVNEGTGSFRVRIQRPEREDAAVATPRIGPLDIEAGLRLPGGARLERLEFYWKEELVGTRFAPPYVQRVRIPAEDPTGFVRVVGYLEDGSSAEDVAFVNSPAGSENLEVELVELYTVVTDRRGRPIRGLGRDDFRVVESGEEQEIATFGDAGDRPLTVGLAIDSSASMFVKLPEVQTAAASFLTGLRNPRDRAFVVGFGDEPFLQRDTTTDLRAVRTALSSLEPEGRTSIWKGIAYSLVQLQGVPGKKALIVFSDGADEDPDFSYRLALDFARRVGVPVYVVVSNDEIFRTQGRGLTIRGFMNRLESLASAVGGRVFVTRVGEDLGAIYREIDEELRSQYLLGYYARDRGDEQWRPIEVEVDRPGARARTITGYYQ